MKKIQYKPAAYTGPKAKAIGVIRRENFTHIITAKNFEHSQAGKAFFEAFLRSYIYNKYDSRRLPKEQRSEKKDHWYSSNMASGDCEIVIFGALALHIIFTGETANKVAKNLSRYFVFSK